MTAKPQYSWPLARDLSSLIPEAHLFLPFVLMILVKFYTGHKLLSLR